MNKEATAKWDKCLALIRKELADDAAFSAWFEPTVVQSLRGNTLTLLLPSRYYQELYEGKYRNVFSPAFRTAFGPGVKLIFMYPVAANEKVKVEGKMPESKPTPAPVVKRRAEKAAQNQTEEWGGLNEALSFDNFCVGSANKLPWTIAESIAKKPFNSNFNPFFLYGDVGVGKTHLMQAIGLQVKNNYPEKRVVFLPMKEFQRLYQNAHLNKEIPAFLQWFMRCDLLLLDDLQEVVKSEGTLNNALFPIFNHLHQHGKQLVFTCDRPPEELDGLEERLIDRFKWGIVEKLERPDAALRKKILLFKAKKNGLQLPADVIDYIAGAPLKSVREIEGIVLGIMMRAINLGLEIDLKLAKEVVSRSVKTVKKNPLNFEMLVEKVAEAMNLNSDVIFSKSRVKDVADARMLIMYLASKKLGLTTGAIGRKLGRKHSTVIHGIKSVESRMPEFEEVLAAIG